MVRNLTSGLLGSLGYTVLVSESPAAAIARLATSGVVPDLLLTDVVMPQMTGPELRERLTETMPGLKTILMSGYTSHSAIRQALADEGGALHPEAVHQARTGAGDPRAAGSRDSSRRRASGFRRRGCRPSGPPSIQLRAAGAVFVACSNA